MKKTIINSMALLAVVSVTPSFAASFCGANELVFHCKTKNNKDINVCKQGDNYIYSFGRKNKVEKRLQNTGSEIIKKTWDGYGSAAVQSIGFKYEAYTYSVFSSYERWFEGRPTQLVDVDFTIVPSGGVVIKKNNRKIAKVDCQPKTMVDKIEDTLTAE